MMTQKHTHFVNDICMTFESHFHNRFVQSYENTLERAKEQIGKVAFKRIISNLNYTLFLNSYNLYSVTGSS